MKWEWNNQTPLYLQIIEQIKLRIISGYYPLGSRLPSVRELAAEASVNPNTMQKALTELERQGLLFVQRTSGRFITEDPAVVQTLRRQLADQMTQTFWRQMQQLNFTSEEIFSILSKLTTKE